MVVDAAARLRQRPGHAGGTAARAGGRRPGTGRPGPGCRHPAEAQSLRAAWPALAAFPRLEGDILPLRTGMDWPGVRAVAFAGIGRPEKFFRTLRRPARSSSPSHGFPDHAPYSERILQRMAEDARRLGAQLVTTEKDAARLPPAFRARGADPARPPRDARLGADRRPAGPARARRATGGLTAARPGAHLRPLECSRIAGSTTP